MEQNELMHYGVIGMRWGVRRYQPYDKKKPGYRPTLKEQINKNARKNQAPTAKEVADRHYNKNEQIKVGSKRFFTVQPKDNKEAQLKIQKTALANAAIAGVMPYAISKYMSKTTGTNFTPNISATLMTMGGVYLSNVLYDEALYKTKGVVRK